MRVWNLKLFAKCTELSDLVCLLYECTRPLIPFVYSKGGSGAIFRNVRTVPPYYITSQLRTVIFIIVAVRLSELEIICVYGDCTSVYMTKLCLNYRYYRLIGLRHRRRMPLKLQMFWYVTPCRMVRICVVVYLSTSHNFPQHWRLHHHCYEKF